MTAHPRSVDELVVHLNVLFHGTISEHRVMQETLRLSRNGAVSLPVLARMAERELRAIAADQAGPQSSC